MKNLLLNNSIAAIWKEADTPVEYLIALWITLLAGTAVIGFAGLFYGIVTGQTDFSNATFGIFDYV